MKKLVTVSVVLVIIVILFFILGPFFILNEGEQAVIIRFGKIVNVYSDAGLKFKTPMVDSVIKYSKKILAWDGDAQRIPTAENQFIWVDTTARWRINDTKKFYESVKSMENAYARLDDVIDSSVRTVISRNSIREAVRNSDTINNIDRKDTFLQEGGDEQEGMESLSTLTRTVTTYPPIEKGRNHLSDVALDLASQITPQFGIELEDIIIRQIRYSDDLTESVYERMIKERNQVAEAFRSYGQGKKAEWLGTLEKEQKTIISQAYQQSETTKGKADARATKIYADAYSQDLDFFQFWRSMESYRAVLPNFKKTLSTNMEYFNYLYDPNAKSIIK